LGSKNQNCERDESPWVKRAAAQASENLAPANLAISTRAVRVKDGISAYIPSRALVGDLTRGPTPRTGPPLRTRTEARPDLVTAGSNLAEVYNTVDDNESTEWISGNARGEAWIEYSFASPVTLNQIVVKPGAFRTRSYPIRITIDGTEVFSDKTPRGLGYVTLQMKPVIAGKTAHIELTGTPSDRDDIGLIEVTGQNDSAATMPASQRGALRISEIEFYEALPLGTGK